MKTWKKFIQFIRIGIISLLLLIAVNKSSLSQPSERYPRPVLIEGDTLWLFKPSQVLQVIGITLERNALREVKDSLELDLSRCEMGSAKKTEVIHLQDQKIGLFTDYIDQQREINKKLENQQARIERRTKVFKNFNLVFFGLLGGTTAYFLIFK